MNNPETRATIGTQDTRRGQANKRRENRGANKNGQSRDIGARVSGLFILGCSYVFSNVYLFVFVLCLVCRGLPMSLDCSFLVAPRFSLPFICLSSSCVLCADGCPCLWIVHSCLPPRFSLTFICLSSSCVLCA
jgi:hypothetical protein